MKKKILPVIMFFCLLIICSGLFCYYEDYNTAEQIKTEAVTEEKDGFRVNWKKLKNKDVVAWIRFKHPKVISYPVLQAKDNDFYLHRNIKKKYSFSGCIFMDYHNHKDFSDQNTIIYGHNMADKTMFGSLSKYESKKFWKENPYFYIYTKDGLKRKYKIYNVCMVKPYSEIYTYRFASPENFNRYIRTFKKMGYYDTKITPKDHVVTLSTCAFHGSRRFIVQGYLVKEEKQ